MGPATRSDGVKNGLIPLFIQLKTLGLIDSRAGLVLVYAAMGLPATVFILTGFLRSLPGELEQSARIDGASEARILWRIMLPLTRPALVIAGIHAAVPIWNDFFFPLVFVQSDDYKTLPQGLTIFMGEYNTDWGVLFAGLARAYAIGARAVVVGTAITNPREITGRFAAAVPVA